MTAGSNGGTATTHSAVSYGFRLSAAPTVHYILVGGTPPADCPGSVTNPQANPGHLCVYEVQASNASTFRGVCNPESSGCPAGQATREGFAVYAAPMTGGSAMYVFGSWAVTAASSLSHPAPSHAGVPTIG
jgi:hypothetical protein